MKCPVATCWRTWWPSSAPRISCSARSTGDVMGLNRQDARICEPPRRQGAKKFFYHEEGCAQVVRIRIELLAGYLVLKGFPWRLGALAVQQVFLAPMAPWRFKQVFT